VKDLTDRQLLSRFSDQGDDQAFAVLMQRHGPEIFRLCKRLLGQEEDAEDALQATFTALARQARSRKWRKSVGRWLFKVAHYVALKARDKTARSHSMQRYVELNQPTAPLTEMELAELGNILAEELRGLPSKFRQPLVLCYLRELSQEDVSRRLGVPRRTLQRRLEEGRVRLRLRLMNRGLTASTAGRLALFMVESCVLEWLDVIDDLPEE
jgi:RNA polymerase sigma factor (sigma-70 family)